MSGTSLLIAAWTAMAISGGPAPAEPAPGEPADGAPPMLGESKRLVDDAGQRVSVLDNGLTVVVKEMPSTRAATVQIWVKAGSVYEEPQEAGITHFIEHMIFKGTPSRGPGEMAGVIEGFRSALLGHNPMPWDLIGMGALSAGLLFISGVLYFRRMERVLADVA